MKKHKKVINIKINLLNSYKIVSLLLLNKEIDRGRLKYYNMLNWLSIFFTLVLNWLSKPPDIQAVVQNA